MGPFGLIYILLILMDLNCFTKGAIEGHNSTTACLWTKAYDTLYEAQPSIEITMDCSLFDNAVVHVLSAYYVRPPRSGDTRCFNTSSTLRCCAMGNWNVNHIMCSVPLDSETEAEVREECQDSSVCTISVKAVQLHNNCGGRCVFADNTSLANVSDWCWARLIQVNYACAQTDYGGDDTAPSSGESNSSGIIGLAVAVPTCLITGCIVMFLITKFCGRRTAGAKSLDASTPNLCIERQLPEENRYSDQYVAIQDTDVFKSNVKGNEKNNDASSSGKFGSTESSREIPNQNYFGNTNESYKQEMESPRYKEHHLVDNMVYLDTVTSQHSMTDEPEVEYPSGTLAEGDHDDYVTLEETDDDMITNDGYAGSTPSDREDGLVVNEAEENVDEKPGVLSNENDSHGNEKSKKVENYVYTYGHFTLEGRTREPLNQ